MRESLVGVVRGVEARLLLAEVVLLVELEAFMEVRDARDEDNEEERVVKSGEEVGREIMLVVTAACSPRSFLNFFFLMGPKMGGGISLELEALVGSRSCGTIVTPTRFIRSPSGTLLG